jgi:predicted RNase H-like nuclease (RuvC/YqgF family)
MSKTKDEYQKEAKALGLNTDSLTTVDALKKAIANKKAEDSKDHKSKAPEAGSLDKELEAAEAKVQELKKQKQALEQKEKEEARAKSLKAEKRPKYKHNNGLYYCFKKDSPKTLNVDGTPKKTSEIIKDKELMAELVEGNNTFLEPLNL